jgi:hypothetical protein
MKRQMLVDCLEPDLESTLLTDAQITPDTPVDGEAGSTGRPGRRGGRVDGEAGSTGRPVAWPGSGRSSPKKLTTLVGRSALRGTSWG